MAEKDFARRALGMIWLQDDGNVYYSSYLENKNKQPYLHRSNNTGYREYYPSSRNEGASKNTSILLPNGLYGNFRRGIGVLSIDTGVHAVAIRLRLR